MAFSIDLPPTPSPLAGVPTGLTLAVQATTAVPMIIPPTYFKVMESLHLRQVWWRAEQALITADRIVFCGYSLPDADMHVKYLMKRAEVNRPQPPDVYVVNNHHKKKAAEKK
jgi:hypothetical protein